jgi:hypothetical protein
VRSTIVSIAISCCLLSACSSTEPKTPEKVAQAQVAVAKVPSTLRVDHAWVKDAESAEAQNHQRQALETLRAKVGAGQAFVGAWNALKEDGTNWHVADKETYPYSLIPAEARDLPDGSLSPIIPGDGGLHLFRIVGREY